MKEDLICFCHLRWNFVYQRPQHLLSRFAKERLVFVIEEPMFDGLASYNDVNFIEESNLWVITPHIESGIDNEKITGVQKNLLDMLIESMQIEDCVLWYYSPLALQFSQHLNPKLIVYDCMDELSAFKFAPAALKQTEAILLKKADIVFTGGHSLYEAKKQLHYNIHPFPSSIDKEHFSKARGEVETPADQANIPHPRIGFYGVVDERFNIELLEETARLKPDWNFVIIGPVVKIDEATLPRYSNIYYLGGKGYKDLPIYLAGWDIAALFFALNDSTKYISPTKTPEYLSGGKPVISTSITDVVKPYGEHGLVYIADNAADFIAAGEKILADVDRKEWLEKVDEFLADNSWDNTWGKMNDLLNATMQKKATAGSINEVVMNNISKIA